MSKSMVCGVLLVGFLAACKNTDDYLSDLRTSQDGEGRLNLAVYDSGLLIHEGLTGILDQEVLSLVQMARSVHEAGRIVEKNEVALCRADALSLLVHVTLRYPLLPASEPFTVDRGASELVLKQIDILKTEGESLAVPGEIDKLTSQDKAVSERAHAALVQMTGQNIKPEPAPWTEWWQSNQGALAARATERCREPLTLLAGVRYAGLPTARAALGFLASWAAVADLPLLKSEVQTTIERTARQVSVLAIQKAVSDKDPIVRMGGARAAADILDPSFADFLHQQFQRETDPDTRLRILEALGNYPSKATLAAGLLGMRDPNRATNIVSRRMLARVVGDDLGPEAGPWFVWYEREGKTRWP